MPGKKILLIDDDADDRVLFTEAVGKIDKSITCIAASNGEEGIDLFREKNFSPPDMIFLDLNMPFTNGKKFLAWIRQKKKYKNIPVIIYSMSRNPEDLHSTMDMEAIHFITKPAFFEDVINAIRFALQLPQLHKENAFGSQVFAAGNSVQPTIQYR